MRKQNKIRGAKPSNMQSINRAIYTGGGIFGKVKFGQTKSKNNPIIKDMDKIKIGDEVVIRHTDKDYINRAKTETERYHGWLTGVMDKLLLETLVVTFVSSSYIRTSDTWTWRKEFFTLKRNRNYNRISDKLYECNICHVTFLSSEEHVCKEEDEFKIKTEI